MRCARIVSQYATLLLALVMVTACASHAPRAIRPAAVVPVTSASLFAQVRALERHGTILPGSRLYMYGARMADYYTIDRANAATVNVVSTAKNGVAGVQRFPNGSLLIKENFDVHKHLKTITAMLKEPGFDALDRNWVMAAYKPDGAAIAFGKVTSCIQCHAMVRTSDFVFPPLRHLPVSVVKTFFPGQTISPKYLELRKANKPPSR